MENKSFMEWPLYERIYAVTRQIPAGKVASYGQVAGFAGTGPRQVGYAMAANKSDDVPWQRVLNARGKISMRRGKELQQALLEDEGVQFKRDGQVDLKQFGWEGPTQEWLLQHDQNPDMVG